MYLRPALLFLLLLIIMIVFILVFRYFCCRRRPPNPQSAWISNRPLPTRASPEREEPIALSHNDGVTTLASKRYEDIGKHGSSTCRCVQRTGVRVLTPDDNHVRPIGGDPNDLPAAARVVTTQNLVNDIIINAEHQHTAPPLPPVGEPHISQHDNKDTAAIQDTGNSVQATDPLI